MTGAAADLFLMCCVFENEVEDSVSGQCCQFRSAEYIRTGLLFADVLTEADHMEIDKEECCQAYGKTYSGCNPGGQMPPPVFIPQTYDSSGSAHTVCIS